MPVFSTFLSLSALKALCDGCSHGSLFRADHVIHEALALSPTSERKDVLDVRQKLRSYNIWRLHQLREWLDAGVGDRDLLLREDACLRLAMQYVHYLATRPRLELPTQGAIELGRGFPPEPDQPDPETWSNGYEPELLSSGLLQFDDGAGAPR